MDRVYSYGRGGKARVWSEEWSAVVRFYFHTKSLFPLVRTPELLCLKKIFDCCLRV